MAEQRRIKFHEKLIEMLSERGSIINTEDSWIWDPFNFEEDYVDEDPEPDVIRRSSVYVYFQPPENLKIHYPCIIYNLKDIDLLRADNHNYAKFRSYRVTFITWFPDTEVIDRILDLPMCKFDGSPYVSDNLYHYNFTIFF